MFKLLHRFFKSASMSRIRRRAEILGDINALLKSKESLDGNRRARCQKLFEEYLPYFREDQKFLAKSLDLVRGM